MKFVFALLLGVVLAVGSAAAASATNEKIKAALHVNLLTGESHVERSDDPASQIFDSAYFAQNCATGTFKDTVNENGWSVLEISTVGPNSCNDTMKAWSAGYLEAELTQERMYQMAINSGAKDPLPADVQKFLDENSVFTANMIKSRAYDPYWYHVGLLNDQQRGLFAGYQAACNKVNVSQCLDQNAVSRLSLGGDLETLIGAIKRSKEEGPEVSDPDADWDWNPGHCSALIKRTHDELFVSHVTWSDLQSMLRVYKRYDFDFKFHPGTSSRVPAVSISFSSYPGHLYSGDDFYTMSSGLVSMETTIGNGNATLFQKYLTPNSVLEWQRNMIANRLATTATSWVNLFSLANSGTYNNEWMIVDYNLFDPSSSLASGTVMVLDQVPGYIKVADISESINQLGYFASYNLPLNQFIRQISGVTELEAKYGSWFNYDLTPRAQIFRRDQGAITSLDGMKRMMRYNNFKQDPLSRCDCKPFPYSAENAISCRDDLNPKDGTYPIGALGHRPHVGTDAKITSYALFQQNQASVAISGPTYDQQPVFVWSESDYASQSHIGMPDRYEFPWTTMNWD